MGQPAKAKPGLADPLQAMVYEWMEGVFKTLLAAEMSLREDGYIFIGNTPSGKTDSFTDDQIFDLVRKADS